MTTRAAYIDGSNNVYEIGERLEYIPMTPERSSTGMYSGGEPRSIALDAEQRNELLAVLDQIAADTENVISERPKGCGTIIRGESRVYCRQGSTLKAELEERFEALLGPQKRGLI